MSDKVDQAAAISRRSVLLSAAFAAVACGGGGSGGDGGGSPSPVPPAPPPPPPPPPPKTATIAGTDGDVFTSALSADGKTLYIGGAFNQVGRPTGCVLPVQRSDGALGSRPVINGVVDAALPDGSGGWYVVGSFNGPDLPSQTLGHLLADGSLDLRYGRAVNFRASAIAISGSSIVLAGQEVSGPLLGTGVVAAFDLATATTVQWQVHANGVVNRLATLGNTVYVAGSFNLVNAVSRPYLAALNLATGALLSWSPNADKGGSSPTINVLATTATSVLVGGQFLTIGGASRKCVAALDPVTGVATAWDAALDLTQGSMDVFSIVPDGAVIYVGGQFSTASGRPHEGVVALDATTGGDVPWNPGLSGAFGIPATVTCIAVDADTVYVSGPFKLPGAGAFSNSAALKKSDATARPWLEASLSSNIRTMQVSGADVLVGGSYSLLAGQVRHHIAAIDTATGQVTAWNPDAPATTPDVQSGVVRHLCVTASAVYAAGSFTTIGGASRSGLAALDPTSGAATPWNPQVVGAVSAMGASASRLFVAGPTSVDGQARAGLAAFDLQTGALLSWAPSAAAAGPLIATDTVVYVGAAAFDASTAVQLPWNPNVADITDMTLHGGVVYLVGNFNRVAGTTRFGLAAVDATTGALLPWAPIGLVAPRAVGAFGDFLYVAMNRGGGDPPARAVAKFSISQAAILPPDYVVEGYVSNMALSATTRYFAGSFPSAVGLAAPNVAAFIV